MLPKFRLTIPLLVLFLAFLFPQSPQPADLKYLLRCFCRKYTSPQIIYSDLPTAQWYGWFQGLKLLHCFKQFQWLFHRTQLPVASRSLWVTSSNTTGVLQHHNVYQNDILRCRREEWNCFPAQLEKALKGHSCAVHFSSFYKSPWVFLPALMDWSASRTDILPRTQLHLHMHWLLTPALFLRLSSLLCGRVREWD